MHPRSIATLILTLTSALASPAAWARVQIHLTYLDREVDAVLDGVMRANPGKTVLAVGAFNVSENGIFGSPPSRFGSKGARVARGPGQTPEALALAALQRAGGSYSVANLTPGAPSDDVIIVVQSPVLGRKPGELRKHLKTILPALASLPQGAAEKGGVHFSSFGTAGGITPKVGPDSVVAARSSLFVGVEREGDAFYSRIALAGPASYAEEYFRGGPHSSAAEAEAEAKEAFFRLATPPEEPCPELQPTSPLFALDERNRAAFLASLKGAGAASLTTSFFGGPDVKDAAARIGLLNVNMEDFHVLEAASEMSRSGRRLGSLSVQRVVADPPRIPDEALARANTWFASGSYTAQEYEEALLWGLEGAPLERIPASADWGLFDGAPGRELLVSHVAMGPQGTKKAPLDPFYYALARNMLSRAGSADALESWITPSDLAPVRQRLGEGAEQALKSALEAKAAKAAGLVQRIRAGEKTLVRQLVQELATVSFPVGDASITVPLLRDGRSNAGFKVLDLDDYVFEKRHGPTIGTTASAPLSEPELDRALYRNALLTMPQTSARAYAASETARIEKAVPARKAGP